MTFSIRKQTKTGENYSTMVIMSKENGEDVAEYRLTPGAERAEIASMRRAINKHLNDGGLLTNYQW